MRVLMSAILISCVAAGPLAGSALAQAEVPPASHEQETAVGAADTQLDRLHRRLAEAENEAEARGVALLIQRRWMRSGSDTADLLMRRAQEAMRARDAALAIELIDRVLALEPEWPEAWHRRAMAFMVLEDPIAAVADIYRTIALEPRHYAAWAGLGGIFLRAGDEEAALASFRRALDAYPHQPRIQAVVDRLTRSVEGVDL